MLQIYKGLSKNYIVLGVGRWVKVKTLRLHYVRGEVGAIRRKHYEKHYVVFFFFIFALSSVFNLCSYFPCVFVFVCSFNVSTFYILLLQKNFFRNLL